MSPLAQAGIDAQAAWLLSNTGDYEGAMLAAYAAMKTVDKNIAGGPPPVPPG